MPDVFSKRKRSEVMARIRSRGNRDTEVALARLLRGNGITGWRRQQKLKIEGRKRRAGTARPSKVGIDFLFPKRRVAVFVDGCFWHGCPKHSPPARWLRKSSMPSRRSLRLCGSTDLRTGKAFWREKLAANKARDRFVNRQLRRQGWRVVRIWEHELGRRAKGQEGSGERVMEKIRQAVGG
jgi:DNA mismatch endonuclease (patch repair protein)